MIDWILTECCWADAPTIHAMWFVYVATEAGKNEFADFKKVQPSPSDWYHVVCLILLLTPFKAATEVLSGEKYSTLALAHSILRLLKKKFAGWRRFGSH